MREDDVPPLPPAVYREIRPDNHVSPELTAAVVHGVGLGFCCFILGWAIWHWLSYRRTGQRAAASFDPRAPLQPGSTVLQGKVEHAAGEELAVRVEVDQEGTERESSGVWSHSWTEVDRRVRVRPFYLRHASGQRIRVEPDERVFLVDDLDQRILVSQTERTRVAELSPGETIYVSGVLSRGFDPESSEGGYRGGAYGLVLHAPRSRPLLLSSEPLGDRFFRRARLHRSAALAAIICAAIYNIVLLLPLHLERGGSRTEGTVLAKEHTVAKDSEGDDIHTYTVTVHPLEEGRAALQEEIDSDEFQHLQRGHRVPLWIPRRALPWSPPIVLGTGPSRHAGWIVLSLFFAAIFSFSYLVVAAAALPWYRSPVNDTGQGQLPVVPRKRLGKQVRDRDLKHS